MADDELRDKVRAARIQVRSAMNVLRSTGQVLAQLEEALADQDPQSKEAQGNGYDRDRAADIVRG